VLVACSCARKPFDGRNKQIQLKSCARKSFDGRNKANTAENWGLAVVQGNHLVVGIKQIQLKTGGYILSSSLPTFLT
jgi:hypothetical protein